MFIDLYALNREAKWDNYGPITEALACAAEMLRETGSTTINFGGEDVPFRKVAGMHDFSNNLKNAA